MKLILVFCATFLISVSSLAQDKLHYYRDMVEVTESRIVPRLMDGLPSRERKRIQGIRIEYVPNPAVVTTVFTQRNPRRIVVFAGFVDGLFNYADCLLTLSEPENTERCDRYFDYYFDHILHVKDRPPFSFVELAFGSEERIERWYSNEKITRTRNLMMASALGMIVMHEFGHHIVGFAKQGFTVSQHRRLEERVDRWAVDRLMQMDENPVLGSTIALGYLSQMERFRRVKGAKSFSLHPMPRGRAEYAFNQGCENPGSERLVFACDMLSDLIENFE